MRVASIFVAVVATVAGINAQVTPGTPCPTLPQPSTPCPTLPQPGTPCPTLPQPTPAPTTVAPPVNGTCNILANKDRVGFDLSNVRAQLTDCAGACEKTNGCVTYTWNNHNGGTCWLKSKAGALIDMPGVSATDCVLEVPTLVCNLYKDMDFVGMDLANKPSKSVDACCDICHMVTGCSAFAWSDHEGGTCWLKKSVGHVIAKVGVTSSSTIQLWGPVCPFEYDTDFEALDIGNARAADPGVCCTQCKANKACKAYTWSSHNGGTCWMKSGKGKVVAARGMVSALLAGF